MHSLRCLILAMFLLGLLPITPVLSQPGTVPLTAAEKDWLRQDHLVRVRVGNWPPFMFSDGEFRGISVDYIEKIFRSQGIRYQFISDREVPWKQALEAIEQHQKVDLLLTAKATPERRKKMLFTDEYLFMPWVIFTRIDAPFIADIDDLFDKTVCVPEGYVMHGLLAEQYPAIQLRVLAGRDLAPRCLKTVADKEADAYIGNLAVGSYLIQHSGFADLKVAAPTPFGQHNQAMAVRNDWPELVGIINKTMQSFPPKVLNDIFSNWISVRYEHGFRLQDVVAWVVGVGGILSTILVMSIILNRRLNREIRERKTAENNLRESEYRFRSLADASSEAIFLSDQGRILDANNNAAGLFGFTIDELCTLHAFDLIAPESIDAIRQKIQANYQGYYEGILKKKSGETFPASIRARMCEYRGKEVRVTAIHDLSALYQAEQEIRTLQGIIPICSSCKNIRDDAGTWKQIEEYFESRSDASFSHGICSACAEKLYGGQGWYRKWKAKKQEEEGP